MPNLTITWDSLKRIQDRFADISIGICNSGGEVSPQALLLELTQAGEVSRMLALAPETMETFYSTEAGKNMFSAFLKELFTEGSGLRTQLAQDGGV